MKCEDCNKNNFYGKYGDFCFECKHGKEIRDALKIVKHYTVKREPPKFNDDLIFNKNILNIK